MLEVTLPDAAAFVVKGVIYRQNLATASCNPSQVAVPDAALQLQAHGAHASCAWLVRRQVQLRVLQLPELAQKHFESIWRKGAQKQANQKTRTARKVMVVQMSLLVKDCM